MPTYEKSTAEFIREYVADRPDQEVFTDDEIIAWFQENCPKLTLACVNNHVIKMTTNDKGRRNHAGSPGKYDVFYRLPSGQLRRYDPAKDEKPIYKGDAERGKPNGDEGDEGEDAEEHAESNATFAYENHLRDYLALKVHIIEPGLRLYEEEGIRGIEFAIRKNRRIDLLAVGQDGALVVIELKVSRGHEKTVGQILTYMGWVRKDLADGKPVRGIIVANKLTDELVTAVQEVGPKIALFEYEISFQVRPVPVS